MLRIKQILQLLMGGVSQRRICSDVHCSKRMVSAVNKTAMDTGRGFEEMLLLPDAEFKSIFMPEDSPQPEDARKAALERMMPEIMKRLNRKHAHMQFVYEDYYKKECPDGYGYTQFCKYVGEYRDKHDVSYRNIYEPGEQMQIDFAGDPLYMKDYRTKQPQKLTVLLCVMPYSNLPFMMALPKATTDWFFHGLNKALEFMGALPKEAKSDNMRQWVAKSDRYSLTFSEASVEWALYYGIEPTACRVRKPRDKGPVEGAVNHLYNYVYARIEGETYYSLNAINSRIWELLDEYCSLPYKGSTRWEIFNKYEKPNMRPLPDAMYRFRLRKEVKLGSTYHICIGSEHHFYSAPHTYIGQKLKVLWDAEFVEIYSGDQLLFCHDRSMVAYGYSTEKIHMPESHKAYEHSKEMNAAKLIDWGTSIGPSVRWAIETVLRSTTFPQQAYGRCTGILSLARTYSRSRLETACSMLMEQSVNVTYSALRNILKNNRDLVEEGDGTISRIPYNENVRGASNYTSIPKDGKEVEDGQ